MNAGARTSPAASTTRCPFVSSSSPICAITPLSIRTSSVASTPSTGSSDARAADDDVVCARAAGEHHATPTAVSTATGPRREQVVEHRHPHDRARSAPGRRSSAASESATRASISTPRFIGPGCMTRWPGRSRSGVIPQRAVYSRERRDEVGAREHALLLHAEDVDDVGVGDRARCRATSRRGRPAAAPAGRRGSRSAPTSLSAWTSDRATRECDDVADDRDLQAVEPAERLPHRVEVEQRLRRMLVLAVARVHDAGLGDARDVLRGADLGVAQHDHVRVVRRQRQRRVLQRLALVDRRTGGLQRQRVGRQALRRELERRARARRRLVEHVQDRAGRAASAASCCRAPARARTSAAVASRRSTSSRPQVGDREQVAALVGAAAAGRRRRRAAQSRSAPSSRSETSSTRSISSTSTSSTWTRSPRVVGRFLPT